MVIFVSKGLLNEMIAKGSFSRYVNLLFLIKDWNNLMELNYRKWLYRGTEVDSITRNWVIQLISSIHVVGDSAENAHLFLVGPGVFHSTFRVRGGLVADKKEITGVALSPHLLDVIGSAKKEYEGEADLVLNEHVAEIPFSIIDEPLPVQEYQRGILAVKVFTAFKDAFKELEEACSDELAFSKEHGLKILNSHMELGNRILIGKELGEWSKRKIAKYVDPPDVLKLAMKARDYIMDIPGVMISQPGFDEILLTRFVTQGITGGYFTEGSQPLKSTDEIKNQILEKEIPQIKEDYCKLRNLIAGGISYPLA
nr:hypothetical protein [Candidatus Njordarchaeota archaeon]